MPESEIRGRLREAGAAFIQSHEVAAEVIHAARRAGMSAESISEVSGLSAETVAAFLRAE